MHRNSIHWDKKQWRRPLLGLQEVHYNQSNLTCIVLVTGQPLSISHMLIKIVSQSPQGVVIILVITIVEHIGLILTITDPLHCNYQLSGLPGLHSHYVALSFLFKDMAPCNSYYGNVKYFKYNIGINHRTMSMCCKYFPRSEICSSLLYIKPATLRR